MKKAILVLVPLLSAAPVFATSGFSGELLLGNAKQESKISITDVFEGQTDFRKVSFDGSSTSYGIRGGYQFGDYFAVEFGYQQYGEFTDTLTVTDFTSKTKFDTKSINLGVKGILPLTDKLSINARLGLADWDFNTSSTYSDAPGVVDKENEDGKDLYYGIGAEYKINENLFVGLSYSMLTMKWDLRETDVNYVYTADFEHDVNNLSLSIGMSF